MLRVKLKSKSSHAERVDTFAGVVKAEVVAMHFRSPVGASG